jgi:hypothetical protein
MLGGVTDNSGQEGDEDEEKRAVALRAADAYAIAVAVGCILAWPANCWAGLWYGMSPLGTVDSFFRRVQNSHSL